MHRPPSIMASHTTRTAVCCFLLYVAVVHAAHEDDIPRRLQAKLLPSPLAQIAAEFPCNPLPLGGSAIPGIKSMCYNISVPLEYSDPSQGNITVFVRRTYMGTPGQGNLLWMLPGGSGVASWDEASIAAPLVYGLARINQTFDVLMMDKRGTGNSRCVVATCDAPFVWI